MCCTEKDLNNKIEGLRTTLNEISTTLLECSGSKDSKVISVSEEMDVLINEFILKNYSLDNKK